MIIIVVVVVVVIIIINKFFAISIVPCKIFL